MDTTCMTLISALAVAVVGEAGYIVKLNRKVDLLYDERIKALERQLAQLEGSGGQKEDLA